MGTLGKTGRPRGRPRKNNLAQINVDGVVHYQCCWRFPGFPNPDAFHCNRYFPLTDKDGNANFAQTPSSGKFQCNACAAKMPADIVVALKRQREERAAQQREIESARQRKTAFGAKDVTLKIERTRGRPRIEHITVKVDENGVTHRCSWRGGAGTPGVKYWCDRFFPEFDIDGDANFARRSDSRGWQCNECAARLKVDRDALGLTKRGRRRIREEDVGDGKTVTGYRYMLPGERATERTNFCATITPYFQDYTGVLSDPRLTPELLTQRAWEGHAKYRWLAGLLAMMAMAKTPSPSLQGRAFRWQQAFAQEWFRKYALEHPGEPVPAALPNDVVIPAHEPSQFKERVVLWCVSALPSLMPLSVMYRTLMDFVGHWGMFPNSVSMPLGEIIVAARDDEIRSVVTKLTGVDYIKHTPAEQRKRFSAHWGEANKGAFAPGVSGMIRSLFSNTDTHRLYAAVCAAANKHAAETWTGKESEMHAELKRYMCQHLVDACTTWVDEFLTVYGNHETELRTIVDTPVFEDAFADFDFEENNKFHATAFPPLDYYPKYDDAKRLYGVHPPEAHVGPQTYFARAAQHEYAQILAGETKAKVVHDSVGFSLNPLLKSCRSLVVDELRSAEYRLDDWSPMQHAFGKRVHGVTTDYLLGKELREPAEIAAVVQAIAFFDGMSDFARICFALWPAVQEKAQAFDIVPMGIPPVLLVRAASILAYLTLAALHGRQLPNGVRNVPDHVFPRLRDNDLGGIADILRERRLKGDLLPEADMLMQGITELVWYPRGLRQHIDAVNIAAAAHKILGFETCYGAYNLIACAYRNAARSVCALAPALSEYRAKESFGDRHPE